VKERLSPSTSHDSPSPDGRWLAGVELAQPPARGRLVLRRRSEGKSLTFPLLWGVPGTSGCWLVWAPDSRRLLVAENGLGKDLKHRDAYRVYDLAAGKFTELQLPQGTWVSAWSADGKRLLTTLRTDGTGARVAWLNADGTGKPEYLTPEGEDAWGAVLSPDRRRVLFKAGGPGRLYAMELSSRKRTLLDEPGETCGYCWSPDGTRVAYTWQRPLDKRGGTGERETFLITCDPDGRDRKTVTSRKYTPPEAGTGVVFFFTVHEWR
jgi:Tol biopolymer transport system component